jgi:hypothetical protein
MPTMLYFINSLDDPLIEYIKDDPVRPEIPKEFRISETSEIVAIIEDGRPTAIVCVAYRDFVPKDCDELMKLSEHQNVAIFYTIWSYSAGAGRDLIFKARKELPSRKPQVSKFVTLSPQTEMARRFHLKNGATIFRENANSVNYEYA